MASSYNVRTRTNQKRNEDSKYIAFACNVDWGNEVLPDILKTLNDEKIKITFFVTGRWAEKFPDLMQQIVDNGHEIGSHGYQHLNYETLSLEQNTEQIRKAGEILSKHTKKEITLFAPPSGTYRKNTLIASENSGIKQCYGLYYNRLEGRSTKDVIIDRISKDGFSGAIVLDASYA